MSRIENEFRDALGLRRVEDDKKPKGIFHQATGTAIKSMTQLAQHQIYADMHAGSMGEKMEDVADRPRVYTETISRRVSSRKLPDVEEHEPTVDDYDFVPGT